MRRFFLIHPNIVFLSAWLAISCSSLLAQVESNPGPGLGNLSYDESELFVDISKISPTDGGPLGVSTPYGYNLSHLANGYMVTVFAGDGGGVRGDTRGGIQFYDISDPRSPRLVKQIWDPNGLTSRMREIHAICFARINGQTIMVIPSQKGIQTWDISDVNQPELLAQFEFVNGGDYTDTPWQLFWQHPNVYVATGGNGLHIIDVSDPSNPAYAEAPAGGTNPIPNGQLGGFNIGPIWAMGNRLVVSAMESGSGFSVLDISKPTQPELLDTLGSVPERYYAPGYSGRYIFFATRAAEARTPIYQVSDEGQIELLSYADNPPVANQLYASSQDEFIFLGCQSEVVKLDASDPTQPFIAGRGGIRNTSNPDFGQTTSYGNLIFIGNDHGTGTGFVPHSMEPDLRPPEVEMTSPANGALNQAVTSRIGIAFTDNIQLESIDGSSLQVSQLINGLPGPVVEGVSTLQFNILNFSPNEPLEPNTTYLVSLPSGGIRDWAGNSLQQDYQFAFRTGDGSSNPPPEVDETQQLLHRWEFNGSGEDLVGNLDGNALNGASLDGTLILDGADDYLELPGDLSALQGSSSLSFFLTTNATGNNTHWLAPGVTGIEIAGGTNDIFWGWLDGSGRLCVSLADDEPVRTVSAINDGQTRHFILTRDADTGRLSIYVDGALEASLDGRVGQIGSAFRSLGRIEDNGGTPEYLAGSLDSVKVFNYPLDSSQASALYQQTQLENPLHEWLLSTDFSDSAGSLSATPENGSSLVEFAAEFDGIDDYATLQSANLGGDWTVSALVRPSAQSDLQALLGGENGALLINSGTGGISPGLLDGLTLYSWDTGLPEGIWSHLAFVRSGDSTELFVNGSSVGLIATSIDLPLGFLASLSASDGFFGGALADVSVFDYAMSAEEIGLLRGDLQVSLGNVPRSAPGESISYDAQTRNAAGPVLYSWDFGDGTSTQPSLTAGTTHRFNSPGRYQVVLVADDRYHRRTATLNQVVVAAPTPNPPTRSRTIAMANDRVFCVNSDNDTVSAAKASFPFNKLWERSVGKHPRSIAIGPAGNVWVANKESASLSVLDPSNGDEIDTHQLPRASRPHSLVFTPDQSALFVSLEGTEQIARIDPSNGSVTGLGQTGPWPHALAISHDGTRLFITRFISPDSGAEVIEFDPSTLTERQRFVVLPDSTTQDDSFQGRGVANYLNAITISPDGTEAWLPSKKDNIFRGGLRDGNPLTFETTVRPIASRILLDGSLVGQQVVDFNDVGMPSDAEFSSDGSLIFVAIENSNQVEIRDRFSGDRRGGFEDTGRAPRSLLLSPDGETLFVHNFIGRSISIHDTSAIAAGTGFEMPRISLIDTVASEQLSELVLRGKELFYDSRDSRLTRDAYLACSICHEDGGQDGRVWDFTNRGEGLRNTISLRGRSATGHGPVHWSANFDEIHDFEHEIRRDSGGSGLMDDSDFLSGGRDHPLGAPKAGISPDLDALAAYVESLAEIPESPYRANDGSMTPEALRGREVFLSRGCYTCHDHNQFTDSSSGLRHDVGTLKPSSGGRLGGVLDGLDTPTLKGLWLTAPYLHDGSAASLEDVLTIANPDGAHGEIASLSESQRSDLIAYLLQLDDQEYAAPAYDRWKHQHANLDQVLAGALTLSTADDDLDGDSNFTEFVFGTDPLAQGRMGQASGVVRQPDGSFMMSVTFNAAAEASASFSGEWSTDLSEGSWQSMPLSEVAREKLPDGRVRVMFALPEPSATEPARYFRIGLASP